MPRPLKKRLICAMPRCGRFGPMENYRHEGAIYLNLDEFECIRLIDLEGMTQAQCAQQMNVARTTAQAIYNSARTKLADSLVNGKELQIGGGEYVLCERRSEECGCRRRGKHCRRNEFKTEERQMKIAVAYENGEVFQHFGHTEYFKLYEEENKKIISSEIISSGGTGHGALAAFLREQGVGVLICGGIGTGAKNALTEAGIKLYAGVSGSADRAVEMLIDESLNYEPNATCNHHDEEHSCKEHSCGEHEHSASCGEHGCGKH